MAKSEDLARRAVACPGWRWMPGMRLLVGPQGAPYRYVAADYAPPEGDDVAFTGPRLPDLTDPATLGCLLALVREAWGDPGASVWHDRRVSVWSWMADGCIHGVWRPSDADGYETEAAALVAALEASP